MLTTNLDSFNGNSDFLFVIVLSLLSVADQALRNAETHRKTRKNKVKIILNRKDFRNLRFKCASKPFKYCKIKIKSADSNYTIEFYRILQESEVSCNQNVDMTKRFPKKISKFQISPKPNGESNFDLMKLVSSYHLDSIGI